MKKLLIIGAAAIGFAAHADTWTVNNVTYTYTVSNGAASIYKNNQVAVSTSESVVEIPATLGEEQYPVTSIGDWAFYGCSGLTSVTIPDSVTSIGEAAFRDCGGLTSVTIGNGVTSIPAMAFLGCSGLTSVTIPDRVTSIGYSAFDACSGLTSVTIPGSVTSIPYKAFYKCTSLTDVTMKGEAPSVDFWAFEKINSAAVVHLPRQASGYVVDGDGKWQGMTVEWYGSEFTIDENGVLTGVNLHGATEIVIPDSVTSIGELVFNGCSGLTSVTMPGSVSNIGANAFAYSGLTNVTMCGDAPSVGSQAFANVGENAVVHLPVTASGYVVDGDGKWQGMTVEWCGPEFTIDENGVLTGVNLHGATEVVIPDSVTSIGNWAFYNCSGLTSVTIGNSVTSIGNYAFAGCSGLTSVTVPDSVTSIVAYVFQNCSGLTNMTIGNSVTSIGNYAFAGCSSLTSVTIPDSVTSIGVGAFSNCSSVRGVTVPQSVCSSKLSLLFPAAYQSITNVVIRDSVTSIGDSAFSGCSGLTGVTIPDGVTSIGEGVFSACGGLTSVTIGNGVTSIEDGVFANCESLTTVKFGASLAYLGNAFSGCTAMASVYFTGDAPYAEDDVFKDCPKSMLIYVKEGTKGWLSGSSSVLPNRWPVYDVSGNKDARMIRIASEGTSGGSGGTSGEAEGGNAPEALTLTITNVVVHYVTQSIPSDAVFPSTTLGIVNIVSEVNAGSAVAISEEWAAQYLGFASKFGNDFTAAITKPTGKRDGVGNAMMVWQDFVAGTDPTDENDVFRASITFDKETNEPVISWTPELTPAEAAKRKYTTYGKAKLTDKEWTEVAPGEEESYNFFKVTVEMR